MDWPEGASKEMRQLARHERMGVLSFVTCPVGTYTVRDPMCFDKAWQGWAEAWMTKAPFSGKGAGIAYMLKGDRLASNIDRTPPGRPRQRVGRYRTARDGAFRRREDAGQFPNRPHNRGTYVMWKGTLMHT